MFSVGISYRGLRGNEQLDFSRRSGNGDLCGQYLYSAQPNTPSKSRLSTSFWRNLVADLLSSRLLQLPAHQLFQPQVQVIHHLNRV